MIAAMTQPRIPDHRTRRRISVVADVDPSTVTRYYGRRPIRPSSLERIERALDQLGLPPRVEPQEAASDGRDQAKRIRAAAEAVALASEDFHAR